MTACVVCQDRPADEGWLVDRRCWGRLAAALHQIPALLGEAAGLGYVQRDWRTVEAAPDGSRAGLERHGTARAADETDTNGAPEPGKSGTDAARVPRWADPIAHALPAGPVTSPKAGPKVRGSGEPTVPIRVGVADLTAPARPASWLNSMSRVYAQDQIGHLSVATELEFWAGDWADLRLEGRPLPLVPDLCSWLLDRLDWACQSHYAIDEFAKDLGRIFSTLHAVNGLYPAPPLAMDRECPRCDHLSLVLETDSGYIVCPCGVALTESEYAEYLRTLIEENTP